MEIEPTVSIKAESSAAANSLPTFQPSHEVAIIGCGPAGIAAAIQLERYGISPLLFEKQAVGGLLRNANLVENYPGFPRGISGPKLVRLMAQQLETAGVEVVFEEVLELDFANDESTAKSCFTARNYCSAETAKHAENSLTKNSALSAVNIFSGLDDGFLLETPKQQYSVRRVIVASGTKPKLVETPAIPPEARARVFSEVYPLLRERGKRIFIVGAGDAAFDYALNLAKANEITLLDRGNAVKSLPLLVERAKASPRIRYHPNTAITRITLSESEDDLSLECVSPAEPLTFTADYLVFAIGRAAQLDFLSERLRACQSELEESGRLYFVGDVKNDLFRQTAIAVGDGVLAAMKIESTEKTNR